MLQRNQRNVICCCKKKALRIPLQQNSAQLPIDPFNPFQFFIGQKNRPIEPSTAQETEDDMFLDFVPREELDFSARWIVGWSSWWNQKKSWSHFNMINTGWWWLEHERIRLSIYWEWKIIPTDELTPSFFRGVGGSTTNQNMFQGLPVQAITHPASWQADWIVSYSGCGN